MIQVYCKEIQLCVCVRACPLSPRYVCLFAAPWTVAHQTPLSTDYLGKNAGVGCHFLFQGIFPIQGLNPRLLCPLIQGPLSQSASLFLTQEPEASETSDKVFWVP